MPENTKRKEILYILSMDGGLSNPMNREMFDIFLKERMKEMEENGWTATPVERLPGELNRWLLTKPEEKSQTWCVTQDAYDETKKIVGLSNS